MEYQLLSKFRWMYAGAPDDLRHPAFAMCRPHDYVDQKDNGRTSHRRTLAWECRYPL